MKSTGIIRRIDDLGRVVIPVEMRRTLDIGDKEALEISVEGGAIQLRRVRTTCVFCDGSKDVSDFRGKCVCAKCLRELQSI